MDAPDDAPQPERSPIRPRLADAAKAAAPLRGLA
jgi:hypothetical protein